MKAFKNGMLILLSCLAFLGLQACEEEGAFENTGEQLQQGVDEGVDNTQDAIEETGDEIDNEF